MRKYVVALSSLLFIGGLVAAEEKKFSVVSSVPITLYGGASGAYFWTNNTGTSSDEDDKLQISNGIIGFSGEFGNEIKLGFDIAVGAVLVPTVWDGGQGDPLSFSFSNGSVSNNDFGLIWGYASFKPFRGVSVDAGVLPTNVGYEVANTYANPNITLGMIWVAQPVIYEGARISLDLKELANVPVGFYAEYNQEYNGDNFGVGVSFGLPNLGMIEDISVALNYFDYNNVATSRNLIDLVVGVSLPFADLGLNFDYHWLDDSAKQPNRDDNAYGVALYVAPKFTLAQGQLTFPIRIEYFDEGTSGIYTGCGRDNNGWTFTITPTYKPTPNTYVRAEYAYITTDQNVINGDDNKSTVALEIGFTF